MFPGAGLFEHQWALALLLVALTLAVTLAWMAWGAEWPVIATWVAAALLTFVVVSHAPEPVAVPISKAGHQLPIVMAVVTAARLRGQALAAIDAYRVHLGVFPSPCGYYI